MTDECLKLFRGSVPASSAWDCAFLVEGHCGLLDLMSKNRNRPTSTVIWEYIPDSDYEEHLRRIFSILLDPLPITFDENRARPQDESAAHQADLSK
jgi:hypothetical protein